MRNGVNEILQKCKVALDRCYGAEFKGLSLYGSMARDQVAWTSDIDLLVLLEKPFDYFIELRRIIDVLYPIQLESEQLISARPVFYEEFKQGSIQLYRNTRREGVLI